jgi:hypothetical protein
MNKPSIFFLGAPKCGTTAMAHYLSTHPQVCVSEPKEPHYFCGNFKSGWRAGSDEEYLAQYFSGLNASKIGIETSVWYLYAPEAVQNILRYQPEARFIVFLRDPASMAYSLYSMLTFMGWEDQPSLQASWDLQATRKIGQNMPREFPLNWDRRILFYREACSLGSQVQQLLEQIDRKRILFIWQHELQKDSRAAYLRVLNFIGVEDDGRADFSPVNAGKPIRSSVLARLQRNRLVWHTAKKIKKMLGLKTFGIGRLDTPIQPADRAFLDEEFQEEKKLLEKFVYASH